MRRPGLMGSFWPTPREEDLLRAALAPDEEAPAAWRRCRPGLDIDVLPPQPLRLLPLVWRRLAALGVDDPLLPRMRGLYRRAWVTNQIQLAGARAAIEALADAGIESMLLKGAALLLRYGGDPGERPMADVDVLVPATRIVEAATVLGRSGWERSGPAASVPLERVLARTHGVEFAAEAGRAVDLHWQVSGDLVLREDPPASSEAMWGDSISADLDGLPTRVLAPADQLLHTVAHGVRGHSSAHLQWVCDAAAILRAEPELDWEALLRRAASHQATLVLRDGLRYLARLGLVAVPREPLRELERARVGVRERLATRANASESTALGVFPQTVSRFVRETAGSGPMATVAAFPAYLRRAWLLDRTSQIPGRAMAKLARRVRGQAAG